MIMIKIMIPLNTIILVDDVVDDDDEDHHHHHHHQHHHHHHHHHCCLHDHLRRDDQPLRVRRQGWQWHVRRGPWGLVSDSDACEFHGFSLQLCLVSLFIVLQWFLGSPFLSEILPQTPQTPWRCVFHRQAELSEALKLAGLGAEMALEAAKRLAKGAGRSSRGSRGTKALAEAEAICEIWITMDNTCENIWHIT